MNVFSLIQPTLRTVLRPVREWRSCVVLSHPLTPPVIGEVDSLPAVRAHKDLPPVHGPGPKMHSKLQLVGSLDLRRS